MQGIWSGTISFSLVAIPVKLVTAVSTGRISFHLIHSRDYSRLVRRMFCPADEMMVPPDEIVRGYETGPDEYVQITGEELESVSPERSRTIEIIEFIDIKDVDPVYFDHPYYLVPSKGGEKAYRLLSEVMHITGKAGIAKFVLSEREYLVAVTSRDGALVLTTFHYSNEILPYGDLSTKGEIEDEEESRIRKGIEQMISDFDPGQYADERRRKITDLLKAKAKERPPVEAPAIEEEEGEAPADLVAALEESMRKVKEKR